MILKFGDSLKNLPPTRHLKFKSLCIQNIFHFFAERNLVKNSAKFRLIQTNLVHFDSDKSIQIIEFTFDSKARQLSGAKEILGF